MCISQTISVIDYMDLMDVHRAGGGFWSSTRTSAQDLHDPGVGRLSTLCEIRSEINIRGRGELLTLQLHVWIAHCMHVMVLNWYDN